MPTGSRSNRRSRARLRAPGGESTKFRSLIRAARTRKAKRSDSATRSRLSLQFSITGLWISATMKPAFSQNMHSGNHSQEALPHRLRIAAIDPERNFGGGESQVLGLTRGLLRAGHDAEIF